MTPNNIFNKEFSGDIFLRDLPEIKHYLIKNKGWIYIAKSSDNQLLKIGRTSKNPLERARTLSTVGVLNDYDIIYALKVFNQHQCEAQVHEELKAFRIKKEFFNINLDHAIKTIIKVSTSEIKLLNRYFDTYILTSDLNLIEEALLKD